MAVYAISHSKSYFPLYGIQAPTSEEDQMYQQDTTPVAPAQTTAAPSVQELYLPLGGGTDPDFYLPADREHVPGRFSRWVNGLPGFGGRRP
jgi:hypothetical protein